MKYITLKTVDLFILSILIGLTAGSFAVMGNLYQAHKLLPMVIRGPDGACVKVLNFENGHAFSCPDVDVLLRRYRVGTV